MLTDRWTKLDPHPEQSRLWRSRERFCVAVAGRRSGKTELAKRRLVMSSLRCTQPNGKFIAGAPTRDQAKRIWWEDLKALSPPDMILGGPKRGISEGELVITYINGTRLCVVGFDKPMRAEGEAIDGGVLDEYADMKHEAWTLSLRPSLSTRGRPGWCWFIGKPRGRNHYYRLFRDAPSLEDWNRFHWKAADILDPEEIEAARRELDELSFKQEYEAEFISFEGRVYYAFTAAENAVEPVSKAYDVDQPLDFTFDFNVAPGTATAIQELNYVDACKELGWKRRANVDEEVSATIGEVWIPRNSNTELVCNKLISMYGDHQGRVTCYGDATGGARGSAKLKGSDWDIIKRMMTAHFGARVRFRVPKANPKERVRVNAVNARMRSSDGVIHHLVCPVACPHVIEDYEGVVSVEGASGEIDKAADPMLTHLSDGQGYRFVKTHPLRHMETEHEQIA